jgi:hypothetical protein
MGADRDVNEDGIGLADAIADLRSELLEARAAGAGADIQLPVESMTVTLHVVATRTADGKAGFKVPLVNAELGGSAGWQRETMQAVTVVFAAPVDRAGNPVKVARASTERKG